MASNPAPQIALSCAVSDRPAAHDIAMALTAQGYRVAPIEMGPQQVAEQYGVAPAVLVIWSAASAASKWVAQEAKSALARNALVEVALQPVRGDAPAAALPPIGFDGWDGQTDHPAMKELKRRLRPIIGAAGRKGVSITQATPWALGAVVVVMSAVAISVSLATRAPAGDAQAAAAPPIKPIIATGPIGAPNTPVIALPPTPQPAATTLRRAGPAKSDANTALSDALDTPAATDRDRGFSREDIAQMKKRRQARAKQQEAAPAETPVEGPPM
jgi:hypothetical protein